MNSLDTGIILAGASAALFVTLSTFVIVDFLSFVSSRYKERYIEQTAVELDDVLLQIPPSKILDLTIAICALSAFAAILFFGLTARNFSWPKAFFVGFIAMGATFPLPRIYLRFLKRRRLEKFNEQLEDALTSMSSALKAGFSINQSFDVIADQNIRPISVEFRLLLNEIRLGIPLEKALDNMTKRMQSDDFDLVTTAILTARQTGGELTVIFERLSALIRERMRVTGRLKTLTAQGRMQALIVGAMPFLLLFALNYVAPEMMSDFFNSIKGIAMISAAIILDIIGFLVIRKILSIDI